ncbi:beta-N-acetylhexosaminidase [Limnochorda sp.]|uniref:beta-N-acetylhexosaminidase n=1 Tax=Limnochorda sp. TaxID=1940279 RepID=UPI0039C191E9
MQHPHPEPSRVEAVLRALSLEAQVGQVFMVGFPGTQPPEPFLARVAAGEVGNVVLFARNFTTPDGARAMIRRLQAAALAASLPGLLISTDQEGGSVIRLRRGATWFPSAMAVGAVGDEERAERLAAALGAQLRAVGITMNLAPVADVNNNPKNPVIGTRSFGPDPGLVARMVRASIRGFRAAQVAAVAKHFPGHGDTSVDSHLDLPVIPHDRARLEAVELVPFRAAIDEGVAGIMTAHVAFPSLDPEPGRPATHSAPVLQGLLREELGFDGLILTDCLEMRAISDRFDPGEAAVRAFEAGADLLLISHSPERQQAAYQALLQAVRRGRVSEERLRASVRRVLRLKAELGLLTGDLDQLLPDRPFAEVVDVEAANALARETARRAVQVVVPGKGEAPCQGQPPTLTRRLQAGDCQGLLVVELGEGNRTLAEEGGDPPIHLAQALRERWEAVGAGPDGRGLPRAFRVEELAIPSGVTPQDDPTARDRLRQALGEEGLLPVVVTRNAARHPDQLAWLQEVARLCPDRVTVVAAGLPNDLDALPAPPALFLAIYGDQPPHVEAAAAVLVGPGPASQA